LDVWIIYVTYAALHKTISHFDIDENVNQNNFMATFVIDHVFDSCKNIHLYHTGYVNCDEYHKFYQWQKTKVLSHWLVDMPHDYWVYDREEDRLELHLTWGDCIATMVEGSIDLCEFNSGTDHLNQDALGEILFEAIQQEIAREILAKIR
jgi:hypothetical protein